MRCCCASITSSLPCRSARRLGRAAFMATCSGMVEVAKPAALEGRGGCWFTFADCALHLGVDADFIPRARLIRHLPATISPACDSDSATLASRPAMMCTCPSSSASSATILLATDSNSSSARRFDHDLRDHRQRVALSGGTGGARRRQRGADGDRGGAHPAGLARWANGGRGDAGGRAQRARDRARR